MATPDQLLRGFERGLSHEIPRALAGEVEGIHQLRVIGRRLRLALRVLPRKPEGKRIRRIRRELRSITRAAGTSRDLDVSCETFEGRLHALAEPSPGVITLLRRLKAARRRSRARTAEALLDTEIARMRRDLRAVLKNGTESLEEAGNRIRARAMTAGEIFLTGLAELGDHFDATALHALRRRIRELRYLADLAEELFGEADRAAKRFKRMQDELGDLHDRYVLAQWLMARAGMAARRGDLALAGEAQRQMEWAGAEAHARHQAWLGSRPVERMLEAQAGLLAALPVSAPANDDEVLQAAGTSDTGSIDTGLIDTRTGEKG